MDTGTAQGLITVLFMFAFIGLLFLLFKPSNKVVYEEHGKIPFKYSEPKE
jgi:cbb3-type cytochrome oxidase subunit 3